MEGTSKIEVREPARHLRTVMDDYWPAGACFGTFRVWVFGPGWDEGYEGTKRARPVFLKGAIWDPEP